MPPIGHSAAGPASGFEQQRQLALVLLCESYLRDPLVRVRLEAIEDIDIHSNLVGIGRHVQVKHHLSDHTLTDTTPELWRTLMVWMDILATASHGELPELHLATTSTAHPDSAAAALRCADRDVPSALQRLIDAAAGGKDKSTQAVRDRFLALEQDARLRLVSAITVLDDTSRVTDMRERLRVALGLVVPSEHSVGFLERLEGWWVGRSVQLLAGEISHVAGADLYRFCDDLRDEYRSGQLTISDELTTDPTAAQKAPLQDRMFVRQLRLVMATSEALDLAVRHYYRAFAQRGRWVRDIEDLDEDLATYEQRLYDDWEIAHVTMLSRVGADESQRCQAGLELSLLLANNISARLRGLDEPVLCRGTLHGLADGLRIGWHPDFRERLAEILEQS
jgi:hypothetical protein